MEVGLHVERQQGLDQDVERPHPQGQRCPHHVDREQGGFLLSQAFFYCFDPIVSSPRTSCPHLEVCHHTHAKGADEPQQQPDVVQPAERHATISSQRPHLLVADVDRGHTSGFKIKKKHVVPGFAAVHSEKKIFRDRSQTLETLRNSKYLLSTNLFFKTTTFLISILHLFASYLEKDCNVNIVISQVGRRRRAFMRLTQRLSQKNGKCYLKSMKHPA